MVESISASEAFKRIAEESSAFGLLDVRSENEFLRGSFGSAQNVPILNDSHRHQVGLCFKEIGPAAAITLGHQLVDPFRHQLVERWREVINSSSPGLVYCWRGGLRSQIACQWMTEAGISVIRIEKGFKGLRNEALRVLSSPPQMIVLGGMTGSGKTRLLAHLRGAVDLESLAGHRGSAFGLFPHESQPTQLNFENSLALNLFRRHDFESIVVEGESRTIGRIVLPSHFYESLSRSSVVILRASMEERTQNIYSEYVEGPLGKGVRPEILRDHFVHCTRKIQKRLGGLRAQQIVDMIFQAFVHKDAQMHLAWIQKILQEYYDPLYQYAMDRKYLGVSFSGSWQECLEFLQKKAVEKGQESFAQRI